MTSTTLYLHIVLESVHFWKLYQTPPPDAKEAPTLPAYDIALDIAYDIVYYVVHDIVCDITYDIVYDVVYDIV